MELKLIKNEIELKNFVDKYRKSFDNVHVTEAFSFENDKLERMSKENLCNFFEIFYKKFKFERFIKDYVILLVEIPKLGSKSNYKQQAIHSGDFFIEYSYYEKEVGILKKKNSNYAGESESFIKNIAINIKKREYLYNLLKSIEKYIPKGILMNEDTKTINEELFKEFVGIKTLSLGIEFIIQFIDENSIERKYVCKLLEYKKEIRLYNYKLLFLFNKNIDNYNNLNKFEQEVFNQLDAMIYEIHPRNLVTFFFYRVVCLYNLYLNYLYNDEKYKKLFIDLFDYNYIEKDLIIFLEDAREKGNSTFSLNINDLENFDKEFALVYYVEEYLTSYLKLDNMYNQYIQELDQMEQEMVPGDDDEDSLYNYIIKFRVYEYLDKNVNFWIKGFGKYKDI